MRCTPLYWTTKDHHQIVEIHAELKRLSGLMHYAGYVADTNFVLQEEENVSHLCHHSEKLAIAFELINTVSGTPLCIVKNLNLRVCHDAKLLQSSFQR
ncbi:unnamed protein product [Sphagnum troendelagicum]|uniref:DYW domain-containing protein n=1 Tax=Sphagnum troendelagicum TaxID=128251 RepID=A0ABP0UXT9_9BRYO